MRGSIMAEHDGHLRANAIGVLHKRLQQSTRHPRDGTANRREFLHVARLPEAAMEEASNR